MASGSESAAEKVGPRWEVGSTEDVVQALMVTLVDPVLPLRVSSVPPSEDVQIAVAKQMHAVVLLYNYHHRKQRPELVFLEFVNFCKLAIVIRPPLIAFMKMMKESELQELNGTEDRLSVTEKAIKDACDIALGLDASKDVPNMEGWPISKLAVLLIDSKKENCMLQFGAVTKGAWSLIEKELNEASIPPEISAGNKVGNKRKRGDLKVSTYNTELLQLGYDVVKDVTGISSSDLEVLETHMTYTSSKEKSATWFCIMQCPGSFSEHEQVPLKFIVESAQGPLAEKFADGLWRTTPLVELHHMIPYVELILCWFSGCDMEVNSPDQKASENCYSNSNFCDSSPGQVSVDERMKDNQMPSTKIIASSTEKDERICPEISDKERVGCDNDILSCPPRVLKTTNINDLTNICTDSEDNEIPNMKIRVYHHRRKKNSSLNNVVQLQEAVPNLKVDSLESNHTQRRDEKVSEDKGYLSNTCNQTGTASMGDQRAQLEAKTEHNVEVQSTTDSFRSNHTQRRDEKVSGDEGYLTNMCNQTGTALTEKQQAQLDAQIQHTVEVQSALDSSRSDHIQSRDEKLFGDEGVLTQECNHTDIAATGNQQAQVKTIFKHDLGANTISTSDHLQNALALLCRKRRELYSQICNMEDALAICEDNVARIRDGGEVDLARQCIKSVISGKSHSLMENGAQVQDKGNHQDENSKSHHGKPARLSEAYLPGKSSCQDLEYTCLRNNWRLPRYLTESSDGQFLSNVVVEGKDIKLHAKGGLESNPREARETAAAHMISVMHHTFM